MHREIARLIAAQEGWAKPVGETFQGWLGRAFGAYRPAKDALNGRWLGHPLHPALTDVPVGALTAAIVLDAAGQDRAADVATTLGVAGMVASAATGAADGVDAYGAPQVQATVHAAVMSTSLTLYLASLGLRAAGARPLAVGLSMLGYAVMSAGAYVGGELVFGSGNMVDRHAWDEADEEWLRLDVGAIPEGQLVKASGGGREFLLVREGESIHALDGVCSHAGGPLPEGLLIDGCVECPWHQSRFRLADGHVVQGPSVYDQPSYDAREREGAIEVRIRPA